MSRFQSYLFNEVFRAVVIIVGGLVLLALLAQGLSQTDLILENRQSAITYFSIVALSAPQIIALLIPLALFVASIWALNRIHKDSEIVVAHAAGMTRWQVASPILRLATLAAVFHLGINLWVQPAAQRTMRGMVSEARADLAALLIRPGQFTSNKALTFYAREQDGVELRGVLISDMTDPEFPTDILARSAMVVNVEGAPTLLLRDAVSQQLDAEGQLSVLEFDQFPFDLSQFIQEPAYLHLKASDKYLYELIFYDRSNFFHVQDAERYLAEANNRLTAPLLNFVLALLAVIAILGGDFNRNGYGRRISIASGIAIIFVVGQLGLQSSAEDDSKMLIALWALPLLTLLLLSYIYFARGRHIGHKHSTAFELPPQNVRDT